MQVIVKEIQPGNKKLVEPVYLKIFDTEVKFLDDKSLLDKEKLNRVYQIFLNSYEYEEVKKVIENMRKRAKTIREKEDTEQAIKKILQRDVIYLLSFLYDNEHFLTALETKLKKADDKVMISAFTPGRFDLLNYLNNR